MRGSQGFRPDDPCEPQPVPRVDDRAAAIGTFFFPLITLIVALVLYGSERDLGLRLRDEDYERGFGHRRDSTLGP